MRIVGVVGPHHASQGPGRRRTVGPTAAVLSEDQEVRLRAVIAGIGG